MQTNRFSHFLLYTYAANKSTLAIPDIRKLFLSPFEWEGHHKLSCTNALNRVLRRALLKTTINLKDAETISRKDKLLPAYYFISIYNLTQR